MRKAVCRRLITMPYELSFTRRVPLPDRKEYINECCVGRDAVAARLLPAIHPRYSNVEMGQEDWGWFIWFGSVSDTPELEKLRAVVLGRLDSSVTSGVTVRPLDREFCETSEDQ
jgi:hypothetical protein